ncbi:MAG: DUF680 domain-containing protein [Mesorhizobium sp.]|jgi:hypothetical protein|uniref:DUF680 domain-containing protein n=1 Tax=Mesorhizobium sp. TaxID=1871066 RepID=UPI000FE7BA4E|nr:DUF680 domain-containing protein [Mesorhizobium sp.]RWM13875.1 MAG: DUF680 domain-containing protein [Mesorhizobium sp.]
MTRIAFVAAAMLVAAMGTASAGSDHYGADGVNQAAVGADTSVTASIPKHKTVKPAPKVDTDMKTGSTGAADWPGPPADNWGN